MFSKSRREKQAAIELNAETPKALEKVVELRLALAAAVGRAERDPIYHLSAGYRQTFDLIGKRNAQVLSHGGAHGTPSGTHETASEEHSQLTDPPGLKEKNGSNTDSSETNGGFENHGSRSFADDNRTSMDDIYAPAPGGSPENPVSRFSETAFSRGSMAGAVMRGTGRTMLVSYLDRAADWTLPKNVRQRKLFQSGASAKKSVPGHLGAKVVFNKGSIDSAVGLVVDSLRDAGKVVDELSDLAEGRASLPVGSGAETLQKLYPFLSESREWEQLGGYELMLEREKIPEKRQVLQRAISKTRGQIERKQQMRTGFVQHLRALSERSEQTITLFESEAFREELVERLRGMSAADPPDDESGTDVATDRSESEQGMYRENGEC